MKSQHTLLFLKKLLRQYENVIFKQPRRIYKTQRTILFLCGLKDLNEDVVIKKFSKKQKGNSEHSYMFGILIGNLMRKYFQQTYFTFHYKISTDYQYLSLEHVDGISLRSYIQHFQSRNSSHDFLKIFMHLLFFLESAQSQFEFCHFDSHLDNILLYKL